MLTLEHKYSLKNMYETHPMDGMLEIIEMFLCMPCDNGPIGRGETTKEEVLHYYFDCAGVPEGLSVRQRLAYLQIMGKQSNDS